MWDNRADKKNPKSPDFKCKDKDCGHAIWPSKKNGSPVAQPSAGVKDTPPPSDPVDLVKLYDASFKHVMKLVTEQNTQSDPPVVFTDAAVASLTATLFIRMSK